MIIDDSMAIGWALDGKPSKNFFMSSWSRVWWVSRSSNVLSSAWLGRWP